MSKIWTVFTKATADIAKVRSLLAKHGATALRPNLVSRTETRNGLLCRREEELCFQTVGPKNLKKLIKDNPLINDVS